MNNNTPLLGSSVAVYMYTYSVGIYPTLQQEMHKITNYKKKLTES